VAAVLGLFGCDKAIETARKAKHDSNVSARLAASAGEPRATDALFDLVSGQADAKGLDTKVKEDWNKYIEQRSAEEDLAAADKRVRDALSADLSAPVKSTLEAQSGQIALQLSTTQLVSLQSRLSDLVQQSLNLQKLAQVAINLGAEADAIAKLTTPPGSAEVDKAKAELDQNKSKAAAAQAEVDRIEKDIADKQAQARQIYTQTDAAFAAADRLKGKEAIDAGNKAMEDRKQADNLVAEAGKLDPQLSKAKSDLATAQIMQKDAESKLTNATRALESGTAWAKSNADRITSLREQAKKIINDPNGVAERYKKLNDLAATFDQDVQKAGNAASQAQTSFGQAITDLNRANNEIRTKATELALERSDPLMKISGDVRPQALLIWSQAAAAEHLGRINTVGFIGANVLSTISSQVATAYKAGGLTADAKPALLPETYRKAANDAFDQATKIAKSGTDLTSPNGQDIDHLKWIGYGLQAIAQQGISIVSENPKPARDAAAAAAALAIKGNPAVGPDMRNLNVGI
jgi:predicted  nucleic acid-binding Zn-ribbon protein